MLVISNYINFEKGTIDKFRQKMNFKDLTYTLTKKYFEHILIIHDLLIKNDMVLIEYIIPKKFI